jgi:hypothetical protein
VTVAGQPDDGGFADEAEIRATVERYVDELKAAGAFGSAAVEQALRGGRLADPAAVLPGAADPGLSARTTSRSV